MVWKLNVKTIWARVDKIDGEVNKAIEDFSNKGWPVRFISKDSVVISNEIWVVITLQYEEK